MGKNVLTKCTKRSKINAFLLHILLTKRRSVMKKVISALLVAVMIMSILPTLAVGAATADGSYRTTVTAETIKLDGQIDEAYKSSKTLLSICLILQAVLGIPFE